MIRATIYNDQRELLYEADFASIADAGIWVDGIMKTDDDASIISIDQISRKDARCLQPSIFG